MRKNTIYILLLIGVGFGAFFLGKNKGADKAKSDFAHEFLMEQVIREMEVSIGEASNAVLYYMADPSKASLQAYKHHLVEINELITEYKNFTETDEERAIFLKFDNSWKQVVSQAQALLQARDELRESQEIVWDIVHEVDDIVDYQLQPAFVSGLPDLLKKEKAIREVEVSIWEAISATNYYVQRQFDKPQREYSIQIDDVKEYWGTYKTLKLVPAETLNLTEFELIWKKAVDLMNKLHKDAEKLTEAQSLYYSAINKAGSIIDFEIKPQFVNMISK